MVEVAPTSQDGCCQGPDGTPCCRQGIEVALADLRRGQTGVICEAKLAEDDAALLRAMGVCVDARVKLCRAGQPCIVAVGCACTEAGKERWDGCRIGLARPLAQRITVVVDV